MKTMSLLESWPLSLILAASMASACSAPLPSIASLQGGQGTIIDNGGDKLRCESNGPTPLRGDLALDYAMTFDPVSQQDPEESNWDDLAGRVGRLLRAKAPEAMSRSWDRYAASFLSGDQTSERVWHATSLTLSDLKDEGQLALIPDHCKIVRQGHLVPDLKQMVRRRYLNEDDVTKVHYYYDQNEMDHLRDHLPLQFSYIAVHEWLWDFADSPWANRSANHLIHSRQAESMTAAQFQAALRSYGIEGGEGSFVGRPQNSLSRLREIFEPSPACDFSRRLTAEFSDTGRVVLNGASVTLTARAEDRDGHLGGKICGMAFLSGIESLAGGGRPAEASLTIKAGSFSFTQTVTTGDSLIHGVCADSACRHRQGPVGSAIFVNNFADITWTLDAAASGSAVLVTPRLIFIGSR